MPAACPIDFWEAETMAVRFCILLICCVKQAGAAYDGFSVSIHTSGSNRQTALLRAVYKTKDAT